MSTLETASRSQPSARKPRRRQVDVLKEQIAILREINAPQHLIDVAERLLRECQSERSNHTSAFQEQK